MGKNGHFPLFWKDWAIEFFDINNMDSRNHNKKLTQREKYRVKKIMKELSKHRSFERQKIIISIMEREDQILLIRALLRMVEGKILDEGPNLQ